MAMSRLAVMDAPKISSAVKKERREAYRNQKNGASPKSAVKNDAAKPQPKLIRRLLMLRQKFPLQSYLCILKIRMTIRD